MPPNIEHYCAPNSLKQLWALMQELKSPPVFLAGGTELLRHHNHKHSLPEVWVDLQQLPELSGIDEIEDHVVVGANTTCAQLADSSLLQFYATALANAAQQFGTCQVRNRCTIGGLIARGGMEADVVPTLYALNAKIVCSNGQEERLLDCDEFFLEPKSTACQEKEIILGLHIPKTQRHSIFLKRSSTGSRSPAKVSVAIAMSFEENHFKQVRIAIGAAGPMVQRATTAEGLLEGQPIDYLPLLERVAYEVRRSARPTSDPISNARYRKWSVGILTLQALHQLIEVYNQLKMLPETPPLVTSSTSLPADS